MSDSRLARQRELNDRHARGVEAQHIGRSDAGRQKFEHRLRGRRHLGDGEVDLHIGLEIDLDDAVARQGLRLDVLDIVDLRGQRALVKIDNASRHLVWRQAVIGPHHADDRNADVGKNVGRCLDPRLDPENQDQHRHDDKCVGSLEGDTDNADHAAGNSIAMRPSPAASSGQASSSSPAARHPEIAP